MDESCCSPKATRKDIAPMKITFLSLLTVLTASLAACGPSEPAG